MVGEMAVGLSMCGVRGTLSQRGGVVRWGGVE